jgi:regulator of CtrA degradation
MRDPAAVDRRLSQSLIDSLYGDALILADEARAWFDRARGPETAASDIDAARDLSLLEESDDPLFDWAGRHDPALRIALSCESLRLTTRLMHIIAWLLLQRAIAAGELSASAALDPTNRLGPSPDCDPLIHEALPLGARRLIETSIRLYARVGQVEAGMMADADPSIHPVHAMFDRLTATI